MSFNPHDQYGRPPQYSQQAAYGQPAYGQPAYNNRGPPNSMNIPQGDQIPSMNFMNPDMLKFGLSTGTDLLSKQREKWMPGVSGFYKSLKIYFAVSNSYVVNKLSILFYPLKNKHWKRESDRNSDGKLDVSHKWLFPRDDINAPDLYIPLMAFITYVLLFGLRKGLDAGFTPELLIQAIWRCLILQTCECLVIKFGLSLMGVVSLPLLDIFAYTGYKYVALCISVISRLFGTTVSFISSLYMSLMLGYFVLKTFAVVVPDQTVKGGIVPRHVMLFGFALLQFIVSFILCWL